MASKTLAKNSQQLLTVPHDNIPDFMKRSPPSSYVHSPLFSGMSLPVTLHSTKLESMIGGAQDCCIIKAKK
ncbi:hypothetical protein H5410_048972 [Solanum commersonii]|uniref:Uncharacterized protein n=1 Tax=Solanum commersonii TaxID=4109 RepID=A0A9J5XL92_SOLCO|nr:hypothetical protein H5410_048972 [Solanum commersonii]